MSSHQEKVHFSERLITALKQENHPISPTYLAKEFNLRYSGTPVSIQSANNWLQAKAIPSQDKLTILALWLKVTNQWLRFGDQNSNEPAILTLVLDQQDQDYFEKFLSLNEQHKRIVKMLIEEFSQQNS